MKIIAYLALIVVSLNIFCTPPKRPQNDTLQQIRFTRYQRRMNERYKWDPAQVLPYQEEEFYIPTPQNVARKTLREKTISRILTEQDIVQYIHDYKDTVLLDELLCTASTEGDACLMLLLLSCGANLHAQQETIQELGRGRFDQKMVLIDDVPIWSAVRNGVLIAVQILLDWSNRNDQQQFSVSLIEKLITFVKDRPHYYEKDDYEKIMSLFDQYYLALSNVQGDCKETAELITRKEYISQSAIQPLTSAENTDNQSCKDGLPEWEQKLLLNFVQVHGFNNEGKPLKVIAKKERQLLYQAATEQEILVSQKFVEILTSLILNICKSNAAWRLEFIVKKYPEVLIDGRYKLSMLLEIFEKLIPKNR